MTPAEGFVFSRIDGHASLRDIGATTGLGEKVREIVARLVQLGAVHRVAGLATPRPDQPSIPPAPAPASAPPSSVPRGHGAATTTPNSGSPTAARSAAPAAAPPARASTAPAQVFDQALLDEVNDLDLDTKKRILGLSERLVGMTHYEVLDVPRTATKKEIKSAYYRLAPEFHPDRWFRRELGSYKARIEAIFVRVTEAQDVLASKQGRLDYDASLPALEADPPADTAFEELTFGDPVPPPPVVSESRDIAVGSLPDGPEAVGIDLTPPPPPPRERTLADEQRRRAALAARLRGGPSAIASVEATELARQPAIEAAADSLKKRFEEAREANDRGQVARFLEVAELAASRNDPVSAANAYRLAAKMAPDDTSLRDLVATWSHKALVSMADAYFKQGEADEHNGRTADAAQAYLRATVGMPRSASVHDRAAAMLLLSGGDVRKAVETARRAVELQPTVITYRLTLAEAYLAAKLFVTARSELERVLEAEPSHERAKALLKEVPR